MIADEVHRNQKMISQAFQWKEYIAVKLVAPPVATGATAIKETPTRQPFHFGLLLDTSGSMEGSRLNSVKDTMRVLVDYMKPEDAITLIEYNRNASILAVNESDHGKLLGIVDALHASASTNLEKALQVLHSLDCRKQMSAVCILTDGENTEGARSTKQLESIAAGVIPEEIAIHTLGYGETHNSELLQALAVQSRGSYMYIQGPEMVSVSIGNIIGGLENETVRNVKIHLSGELSCMELMPVHNGKFWVGNLVAEKEQWIVLKGGSGSCKTVTVEWENKGTGDVIQRNVPVIDASDVGVAADVEEQVLRVQTLRVLKGGNQKEMKNMLEILKISGDRFLIIGLRAQVEEALTAATSNHVGNESCVRQRSNMTSFMLQRGMVSQRMGVIGAVDPGAADIFASPAQRRLQTEFYSQTQKTE